jgi:uncharacterized lipoprotein YmbA
MRWTLWLAALVLAACGATPKESFYTLSADARPGAAASAVAVFVGPVTIPDAVDRTPMVLRAGPNRVDIDDFNRWAEPLDAGIGRVVAENLSRELGSPQVRSGRRASGQPADFRVALDVQRFDSSLSEGAALDVHWTVTPDKGDAARGRFSAREAGSSDHAGIAAAHSRLLARLSAEIAAKINGVRHQFR